MHRRKDVINIICYVDKSIRYGKLIYQNVIDFIHFQRETMLSHQISMVYARIFLNKNKNGVPPRSV